VSSKTKAGVFADRNQILGLRSVTQIPARDALVSLSLVRARQNRELLLRFDDRHSEHDVDSFAHEILQ
jgi:hypothetical protein